MIVCKLWHHVVPYENQSSAKLICIWFVAAFQIESLFILAYSFSGLGYNHRLRMSNEAFFHWNSELLGLGRQIGQTNSGAFGVFLAELQLNIYQTEL